MVVVVTHSKTLIAPDSGAEDKVYGSDYVAPDSHSIAGLGTAAESDTGDFQPIDADLSAIAALTSAADKVPYSTGAQTWALADFTAVARTLVAQTTQPLMQTTGLGVREVLTAARTYYVRTDGSDSNTGLADSAGGAFLTWQKAWDTLAGLDCATFAVTVQVRDGTYTGALLIDKWPVGGAGVTIQGNSGTPTNVVLSTSTHCITTTAPLGAVLTLKNFKFTTSSGDAIRMLGPGTINTSGCDFGSITATHVHIIGPGVIIQTGNYTISAGAQCHVQTSISSAVYPSGAYTITISNTPAFSVAFALCTRCSSYVPGGTTFSGSATGTRYTISSNAVVDTGGGGATYLPGDVAGGTATGGQYI